MFCSLVMFFLMLCGIVMLIMNIGLCWCVVIVFLIIVWVSIGCCVVVEVIMMFVLVRCCGRLVSVMV